MKNFVQSGKTLSLLCAAAVAAGEAILIGHVFGVAVADVAAGESGEFSTEGVYTLPAKTTDVAAQCAILYWDDTAKQLTTTATNNTRVGIAAEAKTNGVGIATLKIDAVIA